MFFEYGDDSVAQLGGVHLACERASNLLTKVLEWGRLMAYLEQSTRYIPYDDRLGGPLPLPRARRAARSPLRRALRRRPRPRCSTPTPRLPDACARTVRGAVSRRSPATPTSSTGRRSGPRRSTRCAGMLPAATLVERRHLRHRPGLRGAAAAHARAPAARGARYADLMLVELRKVIPSFLRRVDRPSAAARGRRTSSETRGARDGASVVAPACFDATSAPRADDAER